MEITYKIQIGQSELNSKFKLNRTNGDASRKKFFDVFCLNQIFTNNFLRTKSYSIFHNPLSYNILSIGFYDRFIKLVSFFTHCILYWWNIFQQKHHTSPSQSVSNVGAVFFLKLTYSLIFIKLVFRFKKNWQYNFHKRKTCYKHFSSRENFANFF